MKKVFLFVLIAALMLPLFANGNGESAGSSEGFAPTKDITWYCTSKPGGGSDIYTRAISDAAVASLHLPQISATKKRSRASASFR